MTECEWVLGHFYKEENGKKKTEIAPTSHFKLRP